MSIEGKQDTMTLIAHISSNNESITINGGMNNLAETLFLIERFLRASGFVFDGSLSILDEKQLNTLATATYN